MFKGNWTDLTDYGKFVKNFLYNYEAESKLTEATENTKESFNPGISAFISSGLDKNSKKLGIGERTAVINSYKEAFGKLPQSTLDMQDVLKIANGVPPDKRNKGKESQVKVQFEKIYNREAVLTNRQDYNAIMIMAYGLRQKTGFRNLASEQAALKTFKKIYRKLPSSTTDWNIVQAITYSGAKK
jgi:hypothetical protein